VPRWVTIFGQVNHLGAEPGIQARMSTWRKPGKETGILCDNPARARGLAVFADAWLVAG